MDEGAMIKDAIEEHQAVFDVPAFGAI